MLQGLGKQLRSCGVDVVITDPYDAHEQAVQVQCSPFIMLCLGSIIMDHVISE